MNLNILNRIGAGLFAFCAVITAIFVGIFALVNLDTVTLGELSGWLGIAKLIVIPAYVLIACTSNRPIRIIAIISAIAAALSIANDYFIYGAFGPQSGTSESLELPVIMPLAIAFILICQKELRGAGKFFSLLSAVAIGIIWLEQAYSGISLSINGSTIDFSTTYSALYHAILIGMWLLIAIASATACFTPKKKS